MKNCECRRPSECYGGVLGEILCAHLGAHVMGYYGGGQGGPGSIQAAYERQFEVTSNELPPTVDQTLADRKSRYGDFTTHAIISQRLQTWLRATQGWDRLTDDKKQALTTICDKIARILNGDPEYTDNWHDIAGYAKLAEDRCLTKAKC